MEDDSETGTFLGDTGTYPAHPAPIRSQSLSPKATVKFYINESDASHSVLDQGKLPEMEKQESERQRQPSGEGSESSQRHKIRNFASQAVRFVEPVIPLSGEETEGISQQLPSTISVTAKLDSETHIVSQVPGERLSPMKTVPVDQLPSSNPDVVPESSPPSGVCPITKPTRAAKLALAGQPLTVNTSLATSYIPSSMPQSSACFTSPRPMIENIPQSAAHDLSSIFNPLIGEYTSITDVIDTSCIEEHSPPCSPIPKGFTDSEGYSQVEAKMKEKSAALSKQQALKQAEETEHQRMESMIRQRLRQISQVNFFLG